MKLKFIGSIFILALTTQNLFGQEEFNPTTRVKRKYDQNENSKKPKGATFVEFTPNLQENDKVISIKFSEYSRHLIIKTIYKTIIYDLIHNITREQKHSFTESSIALENETGDRFYLNETEYILFKIKKETKEGLIAKFSDKEYRPISEIAKTEYIPEDDITSQEISPDNKSLFLGLSYGEIRIINIETGKYISIENAHNDYIRNIVFLPYSNRFISISADNDIKVWNMTSFKCERTIIPFCCPESNNSNIKLDCIAVSPSEKYLAGFYSDGRIVMWDTADWSEEVINAHSRDEELEPVSITYSLVDRYILLTRDSSEIEVWDLEEERRVKTIKTENIFTRMEFSPDGNYVLINECGSEKVMIYNFQELIIQYENSLRKV